MPHESELMSSWLRRDSLDKLMFGYVLGMRSGVNRALPGVSKEAAAKAVSLEAALAAFAKDMGLPESAFNIKSQVSRYQRMQREFYADLRRQHQTDAQT